MGWINWLDTLHDKIDPLDAWIQKQVLGNQKKQEHFIGTYGPIIGALFTGGALGAAGGAAAGAGEAAGAAGGLLAAEGAGTAAASLGSGTAAAGLGTGTSVAGLNAAGAMGAGEAAATGATTAGTGGGLLGYVKPAGQALQAATSAKSLLGGARPVMAPQQMPQQNGPGPAALASLVQSNNQIEQAIQQQNALADQRRMELLARFRGR